MTNERAAYIVDKAGVQHVTSHWAQEVKFCVCGECIAHHYGYSSYGPMSGYINCPACFKDDAATEDVKK